MLASSNRGKLSELNALLAHLNIELRAQSEFDVKAPDETGETFVENALLKARACSVQTHLPAIADDSGLVVPAINGAPGIHSARYAGTQGDDKANNNRLLAALRDTHDRAAYFYCALVYLRHAHDPAPLIATGRWHGHIVAAPRGRGGFGYDPLFQVDGRKETSAELTPEVKNAISHRGQAASKLVALLAEELQ